MTEIVTQLQETVGVTPSSTVLADTNIAHNSAVAEIAPVNQSVPAVDITSDPVVVTATDIKPEEVKKESTILGVQPEEKAEEPKEPASTEPTEQEGSKSDEPAPLPTYDDFQAPEDFTLDAELVGDFAKTLGEFENSAKADHAEVQKLGQSLIERHVVEVKKSIDHFTQSLLDQFEQQKTDWRQAFENDPEIGGNRKDTTINAALEFIKTHGGNEEQRQEIHQLMESTGVGNHPAMIRLLAQAARSSAFTEGKPLPATNPVISPKNKIEKRYGSL